MSDSQLQSKISKKLLPVLRETSRFYGLLITIKSISNRLFMANYVNTLVADEVVTVDSRQTLTLSKTFSISGATLVKNAPIKDFQLKSNYLSLKCFDRQLPSLGLYQKHQNYSNGKHSGWKVVLKCVDAPEKHPCFPTSSTLVLELENGSKIPFMLIRISKIDLYEHLSSLEGDNFLFNEALLWDMALSKEQFTMKLVEFEDMLRYQLSKLQNISDLLQGIVNSHHQQLKDASKYKNVSLESFIELIKTQGFDVQFLVVIDLAIAANSLVIARFWLRGFLYNETNSASRKVALFSSILWFTQYKKIPLGAENKAYSEYIFSKISYIYSHRKRSPLNKDNLQRDDSSASLYPKKILFLLADLPKSETNGHLQITASYMAGILKHYPDIKVKLILTKEFSTEGLQLPGYFNQNIINQALIQESILKIDPELSEKISNNCEIYISERPGKSSQYLENLVGQIQEFCPESTIVFGGALGSRLFPSFLGKLSSTIFVPFNYKNAEPPGLDLYYYIHPMRPLLARNRMSDRHRLLKTPYVPFKSFKAYSRRDFSIPNEAVVLVLVGHRLDSEVSDCFLSHLTSVLDSFKNVIVYFIGINEFRQNRSVDMIKHVESSQIRFINFEDDLIAFYRMCDVYINPDRPGGGFSMSLAASAGLPVLVFNRNDACGFLPQVCCSESYDDYFSLLKQCIANRILRLKMGNLVKRYHELDYTLESATHRFVNYLTESCVLFYTKK